MRSLILSIALLFSATLTSAQRPDFYTTHWSRVYRHELKGLTTSALHVVDTIYAKSKKDNNLTQFTKALIYQSKFSVNLAEKSELKIVQKFKTEIATATAPQKNILESLLAQILWEYFQHNRWRYYNRSKTSSNVNPDDFTTWDTDGMFREIHTHFQNSLKDANKIQNIKLESINELLALAEKSQIYRPTLYDFLAHNALDFYSRDEATFTNPGNAFAITNPEYFTNFENIHIVSPDTLSAKIQALKMYQDLLRLHKERRDTTAYIDVELARLEYLVREGTVLDERQLHLDRLKSLEKQYSRHEASTLVTYAIALSLIADGNQYSRGNKDGQFKLKEAVEVCAQALEKFKDSDGAKRCQALMDNIKLQALTIRGERFIPSETYSRLIVEYKNVDSIYLTVYHVTDILKDQFSDWQPDTLVDDIVKTLTPVSATGVKVQNLGDYQEHSTELVVPRLPYGIYLIVAGVVKDAVRNEKLCARTLVTVTDLALIEHQRADEHRFQVVNRMNGKPVADADVHFTSTNSYDNLRDFHLTTDKNGFVDDPRTGYYGNVTITVSSRSDKAMLGNYRLYERVRGREVEEQVIVKSFVFTDRSIYRPGQTVYFKGILIKTKNEKSSIVPGEYVEVILDDVNGQEVGMLRLKTNQYGSFSGEFKLPASGLTGEYSLYVDEDTEGSKFYDNLDWFDNSGVSISVEEYKRPTFETTFKPVKETYRVNDTIRVHGQANAFSGSKISKAKVSYKVSRNVRFPRWYYYYYGDSWGDAQEIAHGEVMTDDNGGFTISFKGIVDEKVSPNDKPVFTYQVTADVTDINGETRSAVTQVKLGYHTMVATINAPEKFDLNKPEVTIGITTENINGQFVPAQGKIEIYKVPPPANAPVRKRPWDAPDLPLLSREQFAEFFPHDPYENEDKLKGRKGKLVHTLSFDTKKASEVKLLLSKTWQAGDYIMELLSADSLGQPVRDTKVITLTDDRSKLVADNKLFIFETDKSAYALGETARIKIGSAAENVTFLIEVEKDNRIVRTFVEELSANTKELRIPVTATKDNGFSVYCTAVIYNSFLTATRHIPLTLPAESKLEIETLTFKDKIQPGGKETWSFTIKSDDAEQQEAELLASMYDASLDQFKPHAWQFDPIQFRGYSNYGYSHAPNFSPVNFYLRNLPDRTPVPVQYYDQFDWFGFSITNSGFVRDQYLERLYSSGEAADQPSTIRVSNNRQGRKGTVYGRITSAEDGSPLPGVNVIIKGTTIGTVTDIDGRYSLPANKDDELIFSFVGLATTETKVGRKNTIDVEMAMDVTELSEVVVTGDGLVVAKKSLTGSVSTIVTFSDTTASDVVFEEATTLQGKAPGVQVLSKGRFYAMSVRGNSTLSANASPLYIIDGVVRENYQIEQEDIANIEVLKGDAATALYGAKAANGAIIITTKSGQKKMDEELAKVNARKNFNETAFFFPHLRTDENGKVSFTFTTPESLTRWKLQLLAHRKDLIHTSKTLQTITQKQLMVTPNPPRFLRVNDEIIISAKIANLSSRKLDGKIGLQLTNATTGESVDNQFANLARNQTFRLPQKGNTDVSWKLKIPQGIDAIQYRIVAKAGNFSDGEQNILPILQNRMLVTETLPLYVRSSQKKTFKLPKLETTNSQTLVNHQLTLEITSNPAWYAIQSLPYLMEFPHECAEQMFSRFYANTLATHIVNSNPNIKAVFDKWKGSGELTSNLEKNQELKALMIEETPWLRDAQSETEQQKRIALLFDLAAMKEQLTSTMNKLQAMQFGNGGFPWFTGDRYPNRYITQHIASGYGHLQKLNVALTTPSSHSVMHKAVAFLDNEFVKDYNELLAAANALSKNNKDNKTVENYLDNNHLTHTAIHYLYMRTFYKGLAKSIALDEASIYYLKQSAKHWQKFSLYMKGMIALIQFRNGNETLAREILASLKENAITSEELGMYWKENVSGYSWDESPVETQALLIEAFAEILPNTKPATRNTEPATRNTEHVTQNTEPATRNIEPGTLNIQPGTLNPSSRDQILDELRLWLLKNKQTSQWKTTKATTEAIYALLFTGTQWLTLDNSVDATIGNKKLDFTRDEVAAGTGYSKTTWQGRDITKEMSKVTITKSDAGPAWGGLYWQYFEDLDKITPASTPLKLSKKVFLVSNTDRGELLTDLSTVSDSSPRGGTPASQPPGSLDSPQLKVGDLVRIRIELSSDRPMEFIHMKDMRAAGFEPVDVLSEYKWQDGLGYYQSTRDAATNFFFAYLPKGTFVFEYDLRVNNAGTFSNGITTVQCMYAPEFSSHSEGLRLKVE